MIDEKLVQQIVAEVLNKLQRSERLAYDKLNTKPKLLTVNVPEIISATYLDPYWHVMNDFAIDHSTLESIQTALFFNVSQDLIVKGALGITDTDESEKLALAISSGLQVFLLLDDNFHWIVTDTISSTKNKQYFQHMLTYKKTLDRFGVRFIKSIDEIEKPTITKKNNDTSINFDKKLLTETIVNNSKEKIINVNQSTIVTPLAYDRARELGIQIIKK